MGILPIVKTSGKMPEVLTGKVNFINQDRDAKSCVSTIELTGILFLFHAPARLALLAWRAGVFLCRIQQLIF